MIRKDQLLATIQSLPDEISFEELLEKLFVIEKIDKGIKDYQEDKTYSNDQAKERLGKWLR